MSDPQFPVIYSVVIPHYKTRDMTRMCLLALKEFSTLENEIIVIDNGSKDDSTDYLRSLPWISLIENDSNLKGADAHKHALDVGIEMAKGKYVILFHSDTVVISRGWDFELIKLVEKADAVGCTTIIRNSNPFDPWYKRIARRIRERKTYFFFSSDRTSNKIMSYCFLLKRECLKGRSLMGGPGDVGDDLYKALTKEGSVVLILGRKILEKMFWHASNVTSIMGGLTQDTRAIKTLQRKQSELRRKFDSLITAGCEFEEAIRKRKS